VCPTPHRRRVAARARGTLRRVSHRFLRIVVCIVLSAPVPSCGPSGAGTASPPPRAGGERSAVSPAVTAAEPPSDPRARALLDAHAARRAEHCAPPLAWSGELARHAQAWADRIAQHGCALEHSRSAYGENLAAGTSGTLSPEQVVDMWYREVARYRFRGGRFSMETGHFTQLVWRGSTALGCGTSACDGLDVWVCNYDPPGNVERQFAENVLPTSCR
jgi:pathogenesis-related protein 1